MADAACQLSGEPRARRLVGVIPIRDSGMVHRAEPFGWCRICVPVIRRQAQTMTAIYLTFAALVYTAQASATGPGEIPSTRVLLALAGLAVICAALAFIVVSALIRGVGAARALEFTYINSRYRWKPG